MMGTTDYASRLCDALPDPAARATLLDAAMRLASPTPLLPDYLQRAVARAARNCRHDVLGALHPSGYRDIRALDAVSPKTHRRPVANRDGVDAFATTWRSWDIYMGVATRAHANGGALADCLALHALFADLDFKLFASPADARARLAAFPLPPSIVVASGGGLHCYWLLAEPLDLASGDGPRAKQLLRALATALGADAGSADPAHVLRLPGTLNHKYTPPRPVAVERCDGDLRYPLADLVAVVGPLPPLERPTPIATFQHNVPDDERRRQARAWLARHDPAIEGQGGDHHTYNTCCSVVFGHDLTEDEAFAVLTEWNDRCVPRWTDTDLRTKIRNANRYATGVRGDKLRLILNPNDPLPSARALVARTHTVDGTLALRHQHGLFYGWEHGISVYQERDDAAMRAALYRFLESAMRPTDSTLGPYQPTKGKVENVLDALKAVCNLPATQAPPCWLVPNPSLAPLDLLPCRNGLLHVPTRALHPATPHFFTLNGIDIAFDPTAPEPMHWLAFLRTLWASDAEAIDTLQELFGYALTPDTRQQKIFMLVGPPRSGKGVIARVLRCLVGERNVCNPTLAAFGRDFGKQVLVGKTLAVITDARIGGRTDTAVVAETLLSISGEDSQTIERKFLPDWNGKLAVRFLLLTNELPRIGDVSGALSKRFVVLVLTESFYGKEDLALFDRLLPELPGVLNWALAGWDRLCARGYFVQPASAKELLQEMEDLASPEATFLREWTRQEPGASVSQKELFAAWQEWCSTNGRDHAGTAQTFGRNVRAVYPWVTVKKAGGRGEQERHWEGLRLEMPGTENRPGFLSM